MRIVVISNAINIPSLFLGGIVLASVSKYDVPLLAVPLCTWLFWFVLNGLFRPWLLRIPFLAGAGLDGSSMSSSTMTQKCWSKSVTSAVLCQLMAFLVRAFKGMEESGGKEKLKMKNCGAVLSLQL